MSLKKTNISKGTGYLIRMIQLLLLCAVLIPHMLICYYQARPITIMINPAGDAKHTGRSIEDTFERSITLQYAEQLKKAIELTYPYMSVILTRFPGDMVNPLQHANFANRLHVNLYLSIHFYRETGIKPNVYLYRFSYNDDFVVPSQSLAFYAYDQAHLLANKKTTAWCEQVKQMFTQPEYTKKFNVHGIYKIPFAPLIGIQAPALAIEASLKNKDEWTTYVEPLVACIGKLVNI
jgi:N-acetylmuramoyl-L-alanine amidase